ncbi:MAG: hypothetical protein ABIQ66_11365 [Novosphingobium sp.]
MTDTTRTTKPLVTPIDPIDPVAPGVSDMAESNAGVAKEKFSKAMDEARQGAAALGKQAQENAGAYRDKIAETSEAWKSDAKAYAEQAKERAAAMAEDGKVRASEAISGLGKIVSDTAETIDEKLGPKYGDYARTAARSIQETAAKIEAKDLGELGNDAREVIKKSPAVALGVAAVVGFMFARMFKGSSSSED